MSIPRQSPKQGEALERPAIILFAKAPVAGQVKTRLVAALGKKGAADLHRRLTLKALDTALAANLGPVILFCAPDTRHPFFRRLKLDTGALLRSQRGADLGERMHHAMAFALSRHRAALLIGSDCPALDPAYLRQAADALRCGNAEVVLGPALDGGYVLLGSTRLQSRLFDGVPWGTGEVLNVTRARLHELGWRWRELASLADVDRPEDLARLDPGLLR